MFFGSVQFREDDIVLLRPADSHAFTEEESWVRRRPSWPSSRHHRNCSPFRRLADVYWGCLNG